jgi:hypothetical protein
VRNSAMPHGGGRLTPPSLLPLYSGVRGRLILRTPKFSEDAPYGRCGQSSPCLRPWTRFRAPRRTPPRRTPQGGPQGPAVGKGGGAYEAHRFVVGHALAMVALGAVPALAQGQVEQGTDHANSICSFSGLNDTPEAPFPEGASGAVLRAAGQAGRDRAG